MKRNIAQFKATLESQGIDAALEFLNDGVPHRYSAIYRLGGGTLKNLVIFDKAGEARPEFLAEVPFETSFCQFVIRDGVFRTSDSATDRRLDGHPYQGVMVSYHGVPVVLDGEIWGTMCHFDVEVLPLDDDEFNLLRDAAALLPGSAITQR
jgi:GAF domain-containing protein